MSRPPPLPVSASVSSSYQIRALFLGMSGFELGEVRFVYFIAERPCRSGIAERVLKIPSGVIGPGALIVAGRKLRIQREACVEIVQGALRIPGVRPGQAPPIVGVRLPGFEPEVGVVI